MARAEFKREKDKYRVSLFYNNNSKKKEKSFYWNVIDGDPKKLSQILLDLHFNGFPIMEAIKILNIRIDRKDWIGF